MQIVQTVGEAQVALERACERLLSLQDDAGWWKANFYAVKSTLDLYNNFTWFLRRPVPPA